MKKDIKTKKGITGGSKDKRLKKHEFLLNYKSIEVMTPNYMVGHSAA